MTSFLFLDLENLLLEDFYYLCTRNLERTCRLW